MIVRWLDFLADPDEEDHKGEEAEGEQDIQDVCHGCWFGFVVGKIRNQKFKLVGPASAGRNGVETPGRESGFEFRASNFEFFISGFPD